MQHFNYSNDGLALTKNFEGLSLEAYRDGGGIWTVGYGHTGPDLLQGMNISQADADIMLQADLSLAVICVNGGVTEEITQSQFDALVDFCFNVGRGNFLQSSLLRKLNAGDFDGASAQFLLWVNVAGKKSAGLIRRRKAEQAMFLGRPFLRNPPGKGAL